jgi:thioredoxin-related protein
MKTLFILLISFFSTASAQWLTNFEDAKKEARQKHELILVNFSGSDWCSPCIQMKKTIFESEEFKSYADKSLVLVNADFPRLKKNKLSKEQTQLNEALADKYNPEGKFPLTLLINTDGKIIKQWDGLPNVSPSEFVQQVNALVNARN